MLCSGLDQIRSQLEEKLVIFGKSPNKLSFDKSTEFLKKIYKQITKISSVSEKMDHLISINFLVEQFCAKIQSSKKNLFNEQDFSQLLIKIERFQKYQIKIQEELAKTLANQGNRLKLLKKSPKETNSLFQFFEKILTAQTEKIFNNFASQWVYWKAEINLGKRKKTKTLYLLPIGYLDKQEGNLPEKILQLMANSQGVYVTNKVKSRKFDQDVNKKIQKSIKNSQDKAIYEKNLKIIKDLNLLRNYNYYPCYDVKRLCNQTFTKMFSKQLKIKQLFNKKRNIKHEMRHRIVYNSLLKPLRLYPSKLLAHEEFQVIAYQAMRTGELSAVGKAKKDLLCCSKSDQTRESREIQALVTKIFSKLKKKNEIFCAIDFTFFINERILKVLKKNQFKISLKKVNA